MFDLKNQTVISGIGGSKLTRDRALARPLLHHLIDATLAAIADAGIERSDIDGIMKPSFIDSEELISTLGLTNVRYTADVFLGGASSAAKLEIAGAAVAGGSAHFVLIADGITAYTGRRPHEFAEILDTMEAIGPTLRDYYVPFGVSTPPQWYSLMARRHQEEYGSDRKALGAIALACRKHAAFNDNALMQGVGLTMQEYLDSPMISSPYRKHDCCLESDGAAAMIVGSADDRRATAAHDPVLVTAAAQGRGELPDDMINRSDILSIGLTQAAPRAWEKAGLGPADMSFAQIYDCFTFEALQQIEEAGFCARGEAHNFVANGNIELGGGLPINTAGGLLSEGYLMGLGHITEAVRQLRHEAGARQVEGARFGAITGFGDFCDGSMAVLSRGV